MDKKKIKKEKKSKQSKSHQKKPTKSKKSTKPKHKNKGQKGGRNLIPEVKILDDNNELKLENLADNHKFLKDDFPDECVIL